MGGDKDKSVRNLLEAGPAEPFRAIVAGAADGVIGINADQRIVLFNRAAEQLFLYSAAEVVGQKLTMLLPQAHRQRHEHSVRSFAQSGADARYMGERHESLKAQRADGSEFSVAISIMQLSTTDGPLMVAHVRDVSERVELLARQVHLATRDHLTGAFNRRAFLERAGKVHMRWRETAANYALMMLDLDHFKSVNDTHGHAVGDAVIESFSQLCHATLRDDDIFARWGGEEFVALLPGANLASAFATAERIRMRTGRRAARLSESVDLKQSVSIGLAVPPSADCRLEDVIRMADEALYAAKSAGRNRVSTAAIPDDPQTRSA